MYIIPAFRGRIRADLIFSRVCPRSVFSGAGRVLCWPAVAGGVPVSAGVCVAVTPGAGANVMLCRWIWPSLALNAMCCPYSPLSVCVPILERSSFGTPMARTTANSPSVTLSPPDRIIDVERGYLTVEMP